MNIRAFLLLFYIIPLSLASQNTPNVSISKVTPDGGVAFSQVTSIVEDNKGIIWFGTNNGLFSYNTISIKKYNYLDNDPTSIPTNRINILYKDTSGILWVASENGLCSYNEDGNNFRRHQIVDQFDNNIGKNITSFFQDDNNVYWFSDENGFGTYNPSTNTANYKNLKSKIEDITYLTVSPNQTIWVFYANGDIYFKTKKSDSFSFFKKYLDKDVRTVLFEEDKLWIGYSNNGLLSIDINDGAIIHYFDSDLSKEGALAGYQIRSLVKGENDDIWAATDKGIAIIKNHKVQSIIDQLSHSNLPHNSIWALYKDSNKNVWIGTWLGGLSFHSKYNNTFDHFNQSSSNNSLSSNIISCFSRIPNSSEILIGTDVDDINRYNPKTNSFSIEPIVYKGKRIKRIKSITYDKFGTLWVGTYRNGVFFKKANSRYFEHLEIPFPVGIQALNLLATNDGLWVSNFPFGVYFYNFKSKTFKNYLYNSADKSSISNSNVNHIIEDKNKNIWLATENGLNKLKNGSSNFERFYSQSNDSRSISSNFIYHIYEDKQGFLWLGTNEGGLNKFDPSTGITERFTLKKEVPANEIFSIVEDKKENLWIATDIGLFQFNMHTNTFEHYDNSKGIRNNNFYPSAALESNEGDLYFGGSNGLIRFRPSTIISNPTPPLATLTSFSIHNEIILPKKENSILKKNINDTQNIVLDYRQNSFGFKFTSNNYIHPEKNVFKFRLKNFDDTWITSEYTGEANFTNIPSGKYIFEVMASNNNGIWNETPTKVAIQITPPFWLSWYAYLIYTIITIAALYAFRRQAVNRHKLKMNLKLSQIQSDADEKLHQMKLQFFTDISHEFRTPLTLIQGPVNRLLKGGIKDNETSRKQLSLINNNTDRLLRLINQFLDFRRIDQGKLKFSPIHADLISFSKNVFDCFEEYANQRAFDYNFITEFSNLKMDFDADKLDKILVNILSNAFKNTDNYGTISFQIKKNKKSELNQNWNSYSIGDEILDNFVEISITDSGHGISSENLPKLFERFFQISDNDKNRVNGTGIGLSLTTKYVDLHGGQIVVCSKKNEGTTFYINLPTKQPNTLKDKSGSSLELKTYNYNFESTSNISTPLRKEKNTDNEEALILIAEDNPDLLEFLEDSLSSHFRVAKSKNGKEALNLAMSLHPDLIVSDIKMPEMNGIDLCRNIKQDIRTSHIPVILLTALSSVRDKVFGMESGADAYIPKPFDEEYLISQINNLLNSRKMLRSIYTSKQEQWKEQSNILNIDKKFIQKAIDSVEKNISNCDFTVEHLASELNLSRTHLHRKLKSLTNQSSTEFIKDIRLKHAVKLMKSGDLLINEIGYAVGFNSHNYFTKAFKKQYGKSPREYIKENLNLPEVESSKDSFS